jgi:hypothetical protein
MDALKTWEEVTASQFGLITRRQAEKCGLSRFEIEGRLKRGEWIRAHPGVFRLRSAATPWPHALMAATLWAGGSAIVSHRGPTDSPLETRVVAVLRSAEIAPPLRQLDVIEEDQFIARVDFAWPKKRVVLQVHSGYHRQSRNYENDQRVENLLPAHGWVVLKVTHQMLKEHEAEFLDNLRRVLLR